MSDDVTLKTEVWVKKLRTELTAAKERRTTALKTFHEDFQKWKIEFEAWTKKNLPSKISKLTYTTTEKHREYKGVQFTFLFEDAPKPPKHPSDKQIKNIQAEIRRLSILLPKTVNVTKRRFDEVFGPGDDE